MNLLILNLGLLSTYPSTAPDNLVEVDDVAAVLAKIINESGPARLDDAAAMGRFLQKLERFSIYPNETFESASNILSSYAIFAIPKLDNDEAVYRYASLFRYYVQGLAINAARKLYYPAQASVSDTELQGIADIVAQVPRPDVTAAFYALPDYMDLGFPSFEPRGCSNLPKAPDCNDYQPVNGAPGQGALTITEASVNPDNARKITVELTAQGSVIVRRVRGVRGFAYYDYVVRNTAGLSQNSRHYIYLYPDE